MRDFLSETTYEKRMNEEILPLLSAAMEEGFFKGCDGKALHYVRYNAPAPRGSVVILHGYTESAAKYRELAAYFLLAGLNVLLYDQRGHGASVREARDGAVHVSRFEKYVKDFDAFLHTVAAHSPAPYYLFAHSMGGAVAALYLERSPDFFAKAILDAPMIAPAHGELSLRTCRSLCGLATLLGRGKRPVEVLRHPQPKESAPADVRSPARVALYRAFKAEHPEYHVGPATYAWIYAALGVTKRILKRGAPERITIPVRLYAAEVDRLVKAAPQKEFISRVPRGEYVLVKGAEHEIFGSVDAVAHPFFESVLDFFEV